MLVLIIVWSILLILSGMYAFHAWNEEGKTIEKAILHLLLTNTVFMYAILVILILNM